MRIRPRVALRIARSTWERFSEHGSMLAAAASYYTLLSVVPLVMIVIGVAALVFDEAKARARLLSALGRVATPDVVDTVERFLDAAEHPSTPLATIVATGLLGWAASRFFVQIQDSLNLIWGVRVRQSRSALSSARQFVTKRAVSLAIVLSCGALLLASLVLQSVLAGFGAFLSTAFGIGAPSVTLLLVQERVASLLVLTLLFSLMYQVLPDAVIRFRDVWLGAALTSVLTLLGTWLLSAYLTRVAPAWLQGAVGSLAAFMIWGYYMAEVFYLGAAFTRVWAGERNGTIRPEPHAELVAR